MNDIIIVAVFCTAIGLAIYAIVGILAG